MGKKNIKYSGLKIQTVFFALILTASSCIIFDSFLCLSWNKSIRALTSAESFQLGNASLSLKDDFAHKKLKELKFFLILINLLLVFLGIALAFLWVKKITTPIGKMKELMDRVHSGVFDLPPPSEDQGEWDELYRTFYQTIKSVETHCIELEKKITKRSAELEQIHSQLIQAGKLAAVGELAAGLAHELNNPIGGILGYAQFMLEKMNEGAKAGDPTAKYYSKYMEFITRESQRCKKIIQNLLKFARSSPIELSKLDINVVLADTVDIVQHQIRLEQIEFITKFYPRLPLVKGDANQLQQVFLNILINAIKAIPKDTEGCISIASNLVTLSEAPYVEIRITDNGSGIPPEHQDKIFYPFFTTRKTGEGTGLGLSLSYGIIKDHNGAISFETEVGKGTTFIITLPGA